MTDVSPTVAAPPEEKPSNPFSRMIGALFSPGQTFAEIARKPDWVVPAIVIFVVMLITTLVTVPRIDFEGTYREAFEAKHLTGPQMEQAIRFSVAIGKTSFYLAPLLVLGFLAVAALIYWLGARMFGGVGTYQQVFSVVIYGFMPFVVKALISIPIVMTKHGLTLMESQFIVRSSPSFLVSYKSDPVLFAFLSRLDLFLLWSLILVTIGLAAASRLSKAKAAAIVIAAWALRTLLGVGGAAFGAMKART